jgi:hypothetical protein
MFNDQCSFQKLRDGDSLVSIGVYIYRLTAENFTAVKKLLLLK